jgi:hypothetical protein
LVMGVLLFWVRQEKSHILKQAALIRLATSLPGNMSLPSTARDGVIGPLVTREPVESMLMKERGPR